MAYKEKEIEKRYFSIGEVAEELSISPSKIRFWESEFEVIRPQKNKNGKRQFTRDDIENIKSVRFLVEEKGLTLAGARRSLKNRSKAVQDHAEMIASLKKVRAFLVELKQQLG